MKLFDDFVNNLYRDADRYEEDGALVRADLVYRRIAGELKTLILEWELTVLSIAEAARELGCDRSTLYRHINDGKLPNVGTEAHRKVRRADLYRDAVHETTTEPSLVAKVP